MDFIRIPVTGGICEDSGFIRVDER